MAKFLESNRSFTTIDIRGNDITGAGFAAIFRALQLSKSIRLIRAEWNHCGSSPEGLQALARLVQTNHALKSVNLPNNQIGENCGDAVAEVIASTSSLRTLNLSYNNLFSLDSTLLEAVRGNRTLEKLVLNGNRISPDTIIQIEEMLSGNKGRPELPQAPKSFSNPKQFQHTPSFTATGPVGHAPGPAGPSRMQPFAQARNDRENRQAPFITAQNFNLMPQSTIQAFSRSFQQPG